MRHFAWQCAACARPRPREVQSLIRGELGTAAKVGGKPAGEGGKDGERFVCCVYLDDFTDAAEVLRSMGRESLTSETDLRSHVLRFDH